MKLAFVHLNYYIEQGSTDFYELTQAVGRLLPGGVDVFVADGPEGVAPPAGSVNLHTVSVRTRHVWTRESIRFYSEAARRVARLRPDVVCVTFDRGAAVVPVMVRRKLGNSAPEFVHHICSVSFAQNRVRYRVSNWLTRLESCYFDAVTTPSPDIAREICGRHYSKPIDIVPIGVNMERFAFDPCARVELRARHGCTESDLVFIYVGTLSASKNCEDLIRALGMTGLDRGGIRLWIVGDGPQKSELERLADESPMRSSIHFLGNVPYDHVPRYLSAADLGVSHFPRGSRHFLQPPIKVLEYLSCSLPVLATDGPGNRFYLKDKYNAILYVPTGARGLAEAFLWALAHRESINHLRRRARESAAEFDWDKIAACFVGWLGSLQAPISCISPP
jgi:glycosyltransferase involved in cell wall biosynthesis